MMLASESGHGRHSGSADAIIHGRSLREDMGIRHGAACRMPERYTSPQYTAGTYKDKRKYKRGSALEDV